MKKIELRRPVKLRSVNGDGWIDPQTRTDPVYRLETTGISIDRDIWDKFDVDRAEVVIHLREK